MLRYPDEFNTPTFPAGPRIALSRTLSIAIMIVFLLIVVACGLLLWSRNSVRVHPFLVSVNDITGQWEIVGHQHGISREMTSDRLLQESVIGKFMRNWFWIAENQDINTARWNKCERATDCSPENKSGVETGACGIYCITGDDIFSRFTSDVKPEYQSRILNGETWRIDMSSIQMNPIGEVTPNGGAWQISATILSNKNAPIKILAYATVASNADSYPQTLGYYVADFNAYKMN